MNQPLPRIYSYSKPVRTGVYPVTAAEMGVHLRLDPDVLAAETAYIESLIKAATITAENWTKRTYVVSTFTAFLDSLCSNAEYTVRRSPLISISKIEYIKTGDTAFTELDSAEYYKTESADFSQVVPVDQWPTDIKDRRQAVKFTFSAGFPDDETPDPDLSTVPEDIKGAIMQHVAAMWTKRGDCSQDVVGSQGDAIASGSLPLYSKNIYTLNRILDIYVGL